MRVHTDRLTENDILTAALHAGVIVHRLTEHGSRSRERAFNFYLEGRGMTGGWWDVADHKTAVWDEWGMVIARLYTRDPDAHWGSANYQCAEHFHWSTGNRFVDLAPDEVHLRHVWQDGGRAATGTYYVAECAKCTAIRRWLSPGRKWSEFAA